LTLLCLCAFSAFSLSSENKKNPLAPDFSVSAGGRLFYNGMFSIWERGAYSYLGSDPLAGFDENFYDNHGFGIGGFFDATYVEIGIDFISGSFKPNSKFYSGDFELSSTQFGFSILAKYPFAFGKLAVFPLVGIDCQIFISGGTNGHTVSRNSLGGYEDSYDAFSFAVGIGLDYSLGSKLYLRGGLLANFKGDSKLESELRDLAKKNSVAFSLFSFGPRVSIGVGYKF